MQLYQKNNRKNYMIYKNKKNLCQHDNISDKQNLKILSPTSIKKEIENHGYVLDLVWEKVFLTLKITKYELIKLPLKDLYIDDWQDKNMGKCVKVKDSPNYKYLCGDKSEYITRCQNEPSHSCEKFDELIKKFDQEGINKSNIICVDENNHIIDGAHRASWLVYKYGEKFNVVVLKVYIKN